MRVRGSLLFVVLLAVLVLAIMPASAVVISGYNPLYVDIDGKAVWDGTPSSPPGTPSGDWSTLQSANSLQGIIDGIGNNDADILSPGAMLNPGSTLPKQDICRVLLSNNNQYLYLAEERRANNGSSSYHLLFTKYIPSYVFGQNVVFRLTNKDKMITICFPSGSDPGNAGVTVSEVTGVATYVDMLVTDIWTSNVFQPSSAATFFAINTAVIPALTGAVNSKGNPTSTYDIACFAEAAVSIAGLGINICSDQFYATVVTQSSCSPTSDTKDISAPVLYNFGGPAVGNLTKSVDCSNLGRFSATITEGTAPISYQFQDNGVTFASGTTNGPLPATISSSKTLTSGAHNIRVVVTDQAGCSDAEETGNFTVYPLLALSGISKSVSCDNVASLSATVSGGKSSYTFRWYDGASTTPFRTNTPAGAADSFTVNLATGSHTIKCVVTDNRGCTTDKTTTVVVYPILSVSLSGSATCQGAVTWTATPSGGDSTYAYEWKVDNVVVGTNSVTYAYGADNDCTDHVVCVKITDGRGCTDSDCKKIKQVSTSTITAIP